MESRISDPSAKANCPPLRMPCWTRAQTRRTNTPTRRWITSKTRSTMPSATCVISSSASNRPLVPVMVARRNRSMLPLATCSARLNSTSALSRISRNVCASRSVDDTRLPTRRLRLRTLIRVWIMFLWVRSRASR